MAADAVECDVLARLGELTVEQLVVVLGDLGLAEIEEARRTHPRVLKAILQYLSSEAVEDSEDGGLGHFLRIQTFIDGLGIVKQEPGAPAAPAATTIPTTTATTTTGSTTTAATTGSTTIATTSGTTTYTTPTTATTTTAATTDYHTLKRVLRKDWKLKGSIGLPGEKDKLTFSGLAYQINQAEKKRYEDPEICEEVIKCVTDDVLRSLLEGKADLTLPKLRKLLRSHFKEKDPTTLFTQLSRGVQTTSEDATYFVKRMIVLRSKILFARKEVDSRVNYTEDLVGEQFIRTITTGLRNDNIRNEVKHLLSQNLEEEDFLEKLTQAESDETERHDRLGEDGAVVALVSSDNPVVEALVRKVDALTDVCERNNADIVALKAELLDDNNTKSNDAARFRKRCIPCEENNIKFCRHCWACGSGKHIRTNCDQLN
jgi:hypothetical protein